MNKWLATWWDDGVLCCYGPTREETLASAEGRIRRYYARERRLGGIPAPVDFIQLGPYNEAGITTAERMPEAGSETIIAPAP